MKLSTTDLIFFKENGYLIKRGILDEVLMARARERFWDYTPERFSKDKPSSWVGPIPPEEEEEKTAKEPNESRGFRLHYRTIGSEAWMVQLLAKDPTIWNMAEQMLGSDQIIEPKGIRGIYSTLPCGDHPPAPITCHTDAHPFHLGVVGYIDDVDPGGGGFTVWPGSHKQFYYAFTSQYCNEPTEEHPIIREYYNGQQPVDCYGGSGDIILWHHRLAHTGPPNTTRRIRRAVLYEFTKKDIEQTQLEPPQKDMWRDWSSEFDQL